MDHLFGMDPQVVDPGPGDGHGTPAEVRNHGPGHLEVGQDLVDGSQHEGGSLAQHGRGDPPVEHEVVVLIGGDPGHDLVGHRTVGLHPSVAVADAGGQFLGRRVGEDLHRARGVVAPTAGHRGQPLVLQLGRIAVPGGQQVVTDGDGVLALLGRPEAGPFGHRRVLGEAASDLRVVVGQVVLGQQVQLQGGPDLRGQRGLGLLPRLVAETPAQFPRNNVVGIPMLSALPVLGHEPGDLRLDGRDQLERFGSGGHGAPIPRRAAPRPGK